MRILAIDPGFARLGVAIIEKKQHKEVVLFSCCITTLKKDPFAERLFFIGNEIKKIIKKYSPQSLAIETLLFNTNQKTALKVSEARGVVIYEAVQHKLPVYEYTPLQVKMAITGYGRATKPQVTEMVIRILPLDTSKERRDDETDAIAIGLTHCAIHKNVHEIH